MNQKELNQLKACPVFKILDNNQKKFVKSYFDSYYVDSTLEGLEEALALFIKVNNSKSISYLLRNHFGKFDWLDDLVLNRVRELSEDSKINEYLNISMRQLRTMMKYSTVIKEVNKESKAKLITINKNVKGTCLINENKGHTILAKRGCLTNIGTSHYPEWVADFIVIVIE